MNEKLYKDTWALDAKPADDNALLDLINASWAVVALLETSGQLSSPLRAFAAVKLRRALGKVERELGGGRDGRET